MRLKDERWALLAPLLNLPEKKTKRGRPRRDDRALLEGILWVLRTGTQWDKLPREAFPPKSTCFARFKEWNDRNVFPEVLGQLYDLLEDRELLDLREANTLGTFSAANKGARTSAQPKKGKGTKIMLMVDARGTPLAVHRCSASPAEVKLVHDTLEASFGFNSPQRLIGDKAYDSDGLDAELSELGIQMIAPNRKNRKHKTQDGRSLRRSKRRWHVERTIAWLQSFRRVRTRDEHKAQHFLSFVQLACILILLRRISG
ncbi:IS5 family transposase [Deinococcus irradiatisoli]|uniref:IS5 family transposase n=1 Tax=Deinococcus irradiatisoli TaxID=2202254 RepID=A0A2Z3JPP0_9DEIO|nr:IS5 family transposase [Deinococcus irradiatisoli]AWN24679.1 IS5 family transposase [Deinococcus irradiatisoli]